MPVRTILLTIAFVASAATTLVILFGWMPVPLWLLGPFGGLVVYAVAAVSVLLAFLIAWSGTGSG